MSAPPGPCPGFEAQRFRPNFCKTCLKPKVSHAQIPEPVAGGGGRGERPSMQRKTSTGSVLPPGVRPMPPGARRSFHAPSPPVRTAESPRAAAAAAARPPPLRVDPTALETFKQRQSTGPRKPIVPLGSKPASKRRSASVFGSLRKAQDDQADAAKFIPQVLLKGILQGGMKLERAQTEELVRTALSFSKTAPAKEPLLLASASERDFLEELQEQIKNFLMEQDELRKVVKAQSYVRRWLVTKRFNGLQPEDYAVMKRRNDTYLDLVRTEKSYIASTDNLIEYFVVPLRHEDFIAPHECASLFSNIELIATAHKDLLKELDAAAEDWPFLGNVGRIFLNINPMLKAYSVFVGNFKNAINEIERIQQENAKFAAFIAEQEKSSLADLQTLVSMPVNRISQYEHHLQVLAETEIEGTPAHADYVQAFSVLSQSSTVVQKSLVQSAETAKLFNCQRRLKSEKPLSLLKPGRKAISEVKFKKHTLMLFNDLVIVAKSAEQKTFRSANRAKSNKADKKKQFGEGLRVKAIAEMDKVHIKETGDKTFEVEVEGEVFKIQAGTAEDKYSWVRSFRYVEEEKNRAKIFGQSLADTVAREERSSGIPYMLEKIADFLEQHLDTAGLFRVAGSKTEILELQAIFDKGGVEAVNHDLSKNNIFSVCDCYKSYFRALPEPLLGYNLYKPLLELMDDTSVEKAERLQKIKELIYMWTPSFAVKVMKFLVMFLVKVAGHSEQNKMTEANLSIVFGPTLLWPLENTLESAMDIPAINSCVQLIIENVDAVFN